MSPKMLVNNAIKNAEIHGLFDMHFKTLKKSVCKGGLYCVSVYLSLPICFTLQSIHYVFKPVCTVSLQYIQL